jgi:hypothetical protein
MPKLYVLSGHDVGKSFEVGDGALVGRDPECAVRLRDPSVSRRHACLERGESGWSIADTQSRNGVHVRGARVASAPLADGAEFVVGEVLLRFRADVASAASEPAPREKEVARASTASAKDASDEGEIVLEGDWDEDLSTMARTTIAPQVPSIGSRAEIPTSTRAPSGPTAQPAAVRDAPSPQPEIARAPSAPSRVPDRPIASGSSAMSAASAANAASAGGVAHRVASPTSVNRGILQYHREVDRPGFFNADLSQQPLWLKLALSALAVLVFAAIFWFAFQSTSFLKGKAQHDSPDAQTEENG